MRKLKSCLCDEGVSDVKFSCEDGGWDMADAGSGGCDDSGRSRNLLRFRRWHRCKGRSRDKGDRLSPEPLFGGREKWGLTRLSVGGRLAPDTTASLCGGHVRMGGRCFNLAGFRKRGRVNDWRVTGGRWREDFLESWSRGFVFGGGSTAVHTYFSLGARKATTEILGRFTGVRGVIEEGATEVTRDGRGGVIGANEAALAFGFSIGSFGWLSGIDACVTRLVAGVGLIGGFGGFRGICPFLLKEVTKIREFSVLEHWKFRIGGEGVSCGVDEVAGEDGEESVAGIVLAYCGYAFAGLEIAELGKGTFKFNKELGGGFPFVGFDLLPIDQGILHGGFRFKFLVESGEELLSSLFPGGGDEIRGVPAGFGDGGVRVFESLKDSAEGLVVELWWGFINSIEEVIEVCSIGFVFPDVCEFRNFRSFKEFCLRGEGGSGLGRSMSLDNWALMKVVSV